MDKKTKNILTVIAGLLIIGIPIYVYLSHVSYELKEGSRIAQQAFDPTTTIGKANVASRIKTNEEFDHWSKGDAYIKQGQYDLAIDEYKLVNKYGRMEWDSRTLLSKAYEMAGRYKEALAELDWIIACKPRQEVLKGFVDRKEVLLKKIKTKEQAASL